MTAPEISGGLGVNRAAMERQEKGGSSWLPGTHARCSPSRLPRPSSLSGAGMGRTAGGLLTQEPGQEPGEKLRGEGVSPTPQQGRSRQEEALCGAAAPS